MRVRIWLAENDGVHGRVWVFHIRGYPETNARPHPSVGWTRNWIDTLTEALRRMKEA